MRAFITGSRAYGKPTGDSDCDLVVLVSYQDLERLTGVADRAARKPGYEHVASLYFGKLNVIAMTDESLFAAWRFGTTALAKSGGATREQAVELFKSLFERLSDNATT